MAAIAILAGRLSTGLTTPLFRFEEKRALNYEIIFFDKLSTHMS
jgi:hypothetical protein